MRVEEVNTAIAPNGSVYLCGMQTLVYGVWYLVAGNKFERTNSRAYASRVPWSTRSYKYTRYIIPAEYIPGVEYLYRYTSYRTVCKYIPQAYQGGTKKKSTTHYPFPELDRGWYSEVKTNLKKQAILSIRTEIPIPWFVFFSSTFPGTWRRGSDPRARLGIPSN